MEVLTLGTLLQVGMAILMLTLPGSALYLLSRQALGRDGPGGVRYASFFGVGLSIAFWPLLLLYADLVGLPFSPVLAWTVMLVSAAYVAWRIVALGGITLPADAWPYAIALAGLTLLALVFRLGDIAGLDAPMFGDSLHHTMITTMILDGERLPNDWLPYIPVGTFTYHFGFHTLSAVLAQLAGVKAPQAVLIMGQVLNVMAVPAAYLLNRCLFGSRLAGLGAALITGFVSIMPAFYVNWGRYTQLSGHILLVVALAVIVGIRDQGPGISNTKAHVSRITYHVSRITRRFVSKDVVLLAICVAGLVVVHYRVLIFFGLFLVALAAWQIISLWGRWRELRGLWARLLAATVLGLLIALPWIIHLLANYIPNLARRLATVTPEYLATYNDPGAIRVFTGTLLPVLAFLGIVAALAGLERRRRADGGRWTVDGGRNAEEGLDHNTTTEKANGDYRPPSTVHRPPSPQGLALVLAVWALLLIGSLWVVPGAIGGYTVAITLYIPLAALGGFGIDRMLRWALRRIKLGRWEEWLPALGMLAIAPLAAFFTGAWHLGDPANYAYLQKADREAFAWIRDNTPPGSKFMISSEFSYAGRGLTATDAGMWLPLLAGEGQTVSIPASITGNEQPIDPEFFADTRKLAAYTQPVGAPGEAGDSLQVNLVARGIIPHTGSITDAEALGLMKKLGCKYAYVGAHGGLSKPRLDVDAMKSDPGHFTLRYARDGVYLFEIAP
jgi:hypothetical protein